jgi:hypothetical protein
MEDRTYLVTLKPPRWAVQQVVAACYEIRGEHLAFINAEGQLTAQFLVEDVQSWSGPQCSATKTDKEPPKRD